MPRKYRMNSRTTAVEVTQSRIVRAAKTLHVDQGVQGTSYFEIAQKAGVAQATVYRHFPSLADLIPACASSIAVLQPITSKSRISAATARIHHPRNLRMLRTRWRLVTGCPPRRGLDPCAIGGDSGTTKES